MKIMAGMLVTWCCLFIFYTSRAARPIQVIKSWAAIVTEDKPVSSLFLRDQGRQIHPGRQSHPDHQVLGRHLHRGQAGKFSSST
jgi:hypothetical protein